MSAFSVQKAATNVIQTAVPSTSKSCAKYRSKPSSDGWVRFSVAKRLCGPKQGITSGFNFPLSLPLFLLGLSLTSDFGLWKVLLQLSFTHDLFQSLERLALTDSTVAAYLYRFSLLNIMSKWLHIKGKRSQTHQFKVYSHTTVDCHYNRCDCRRPSIRFRHLQALPDHQEEAGWGRATPMRAKHYETDHGERKWAWTSSRYF